MTQALRYDYCNAGVYSLDWPYCDSWGRVKKNKSYWNFRRRRASQVAEERKVNDDLLIEQTLAGDREAFGKLALKYQDRVFNLALPIVGNPEDALDVTQETFVQALTHLEGFRRSSRFYTWLYRIAYNCAVGALRRRRRTTSIDAFVEEFGDSFEADIDAPDAQSRRADDARVLNAALQRLPDEYREPLSLREIQGASYDEIAEALGVPIGTVRSRLHRARAALREILERAGYRS